MKRRLSTSPPPRSRSRSSYTIDPFSSTSLTQSESISNYKLGKVIGQGTSATVILAEHTTTKKTYVIKSFKNPQRSKANLHQRIQQEVKIFKRICESDHPFIVKFRGFILNESEISIILEYINGLNLLQKLETNGPFNESQAKFYITEIATGISFLHSKRIIHRDLKLDNMMISNDGHIKLIDFGLSEILQGSQTHLSIPSGAMHIRPPEMIRREPYSFNVDWYALGVALYELLTDHEPFFRRNCYLHQIEPSSNSEPSLTIKGCPDECFTTYDFRNWSDLSVTSFNQLHKFNQTPNK